MPTNALGAPASKRVPEPAATTITAMRGTGIRVTSSRYRARCGDDEGADAAASAPSGVSAQEARTSSSRAPALSSSIFSARASSEMRIWRAFASIRFSPADRPRS